MNTRIKAMFACLLLWAGSAKATLIDFEGVIADGESFYSTDRLYVGDGFLLRDAFGFDEVTLYAPSAGFNHNGSDIFGMAGYSTFEISDFGGELFSLLSFDATNLDPAGYSDFIIEGIYGTGGHISSGFFYPDRNSFTTFSFDVAWSGLKKVYIHNLGSAMAIDNINLALASVPEPASLALLALGLAGIGFSRKKYR